MDPQLYSYSIRLAGPDDVPRIQEIEDEAGTVFSGLGLIDEALDASFPFDDLTRLVGMEQVWVGCLRDGLPVGTVIASVRDDAAYVEEMDVLPAYGRRGLGASLLACVCAWVWAQHRQAVTLSTFSHVPWNGPFYRKYGFRDLDPAEWTPGMRAIRETEVRHRLCGHARVFMRRELCTFPSRNDRVWSSPYFARPRAKSYTFSASVSEPFSHKLKEDADTGRPL